jgi:hypothetical protein
LHFAVRSAYPGSAAACKDGAGGFAGAGGNCGAWPWPDAKADPSKNKVIVRTAFEFMDAALQVPGSRPGK